MNIDTKISIKEVVQWGIMLVTAALFFSGLNSKVDNIDKKVDGIILSNDKRDDKREVFDKSIQNQLSTNSLQIELLKQEFKIFKDKIK